ncbi:MAG: hypothetical protein MZV70_36110 [Desulfobacterales bacterium]|nr:hypothetical protein [Desulfobacterales bacterium]
MTHRLIVYKTAMLIAVMLEADILTLRRYLPLAVRLLPGENVVGPVPVQASVYQGIGRGEDSSRDDRDKAFYDPDWK